MSLPSTNAPSELSDLSTQNGTMSIDLYAGYSNSNIASDYNINPLSLS